MITGQEINTCSGSIEMVDFTAEQAQKDGLFEPRPRHAGCHEPISNDPPAPCLGSACWSLAVASLG